MPHCSSAVATCYVAGWLGDNGLDLYATVYVSCHCPAPEELRVVSLGLKGMWASCASFWNVPAVNKLGRAIEAVTSCVFQLMPIGR